MKKTNLSKIVQAIVIGVMSLSIAVGGLSPLAGASVVHAEVITYTNAFNEVVTEDVETSGQCGANVYWNYDQTSKILTISGTGTTYNYQYSDQIASTQPWSKIRKTIKKIVIKKGITGIGNYNFGVRTFTIWIM